MQQKTGPETAVQGAPPAFPIESFVQDWLTHLNGYGSRSPLTIRAYRGDAGKFVDFLLTRHLPTSVDEITHRHVRAFAASLSDKAPATINRNLDALSSFFGHLRDTGIIDSNPVSAVERPRRSRKLPRAATVEQCRALTAAAETARDRAMVLLLTCTGLRRGELLGLRIGDLSADLSEIKVRGKGERERVLPIPEQCQDALNDYLEERGTESPSLFVNNADNRVGTTTFHRWFRRLLKAAKLADSDLTPHSLRHAYATNLLRAGVDLETIRELMGHSDISVTGRYLSTDPSRKRKAVESLPDFGSEEAIEHE
jgi:site-specific recombinase XerD